MSKWWFSINSETKEMDLAYVFDPWSRQEYYAKILTSAFSGKLEIIHRILYTESMFNGYFNIYLISYFFYKTFLYYPYLYQIISFSNKITGQSQIQL